MKEPRSRIIRDKTDRHVVRSAVTKGDDIAPDRIHEVGLVATGNPDNIEVVLENNSLVRGNEMQSGPHTPCRCTGC